MFFFHMFSKQNKHVPLIALIASFTARGSKDAHATCKSTRSVGRHGDTR